MLPTQRNELTVATRPLNIRGAMRPDKEFVCLLIDTSSSMGEFFKTKRKIECVADSIIAITSQSSPRQTAYSLASFDSASRVLVDMTNQYLSIQSQMLTVGGGTNMADGIAFAIATGPHRIILLSDGEPTCETSAVKNQALIAREKNIKIDTVAVGNFGVDLLKWIADNTGGKFFVAETPEQLEKLFITLETRNRLMLEHKA